MAVVDIFEGGGTMAQGGFFHAGGQSSIFAQGPFPIDEQTEALFETEGVDLGQLQLLFECLAHADQSQGRKSL
jgi:hypothetical protein